MYQEKITVIDNFFSKKTFKKIYDEIDKLPYQNVFALGSGGGDVQKSYFSYNLNKKLDHPAIIEVQKYFPELDVSTHRANYFVTTKTIEPNVHQDRFQINCLIYIKGNMKMNNGTGFWEEDGEKKYSLNCHVGFKPNRAIVFEGKRLHASLQFNEDSGKRYAMSNSFKCPY